MKKYIYQSLGFLFAYENYLYNLYLFNVKAHKIW